MEGTAHIEQKRPHTESEIEVSRHTTIKKDVTRFLHDYRSLRAGVGQRISHYYLIV